VNLHKKLPRQALAVKRSIGLIGEVGFVLDAVSQKIE
jgi:hypothetical protein